MRYEDDRYHEVIDEFLKYIKERGYSALPSWVVTILTMFAGWIFDNPKRINMVIKSQRETASILRRHRKG